MRAVHPIERRSYEILHDRIDLSELPPLSRAVVERIVHATADLDYVDDLVCDERALERGRAALADGAPVVADVAMVAAGITSRPVVCAVDAAGPDAVPTRAAAGIRAAFAAVGPGAVWVVGCAPSALAELLTLPASPALVVGLPVGFVGAAEAKEGLRASGWPALSNRSAKGGSPVAAAALNALLYAEVGT